MASYLKTLDQKTFLTIWSARNAVRKISATFTVVQPLQQTNAIIFIVMNVVINGGMNKMLCPHCNAEVEGTWVDQGIGAYEYWGQMCNDKRMEFVCEECDGELEPDEDYHSYLQNSKNDYMIESRL
jgi:hypothetical protein